MEEERSPLLPRSMLAETQPASCIKRLWKKVRQSGLILSLGFAFLALVVLTIITSFGFSSALLDREAQLILTTVRLPNHIVPLDYYLDFDTNMEDLSFEGKVAIKLQVVEKERFIALHYSDLKVWGGVLNAVDVKGTLENAMIVPLRNSTNEQTSKLLFEFGEPLEIGTYMLTIQYSGLLTDSLRGYYRAKVEDDGKTSKFIATTQFEPTDARKAFPCFDEPEMKAIFHIKMTIPSNHHALSNMPVKKTAILEEQEKKVVVFEPTRRMSTYLVAFVVSDFESISGKTADGIDVAIWTQKGKTNQGRYGLQVAIKVLEYYQKAYQVDYPLPKVDLIAIPDFSAGAMENWGLITYRDTALLFDEKLSSASNKQWVADVIAHELAHQWFGNLVTMSWWNDLWLNEGFAQFMEYKGTDAAEPDWKMIDQFVSLDVVRALHADASVFTHPIAAPVENPEEIQEIFDDISYGKGATVLRMLEMWLDQAAGPNHFFNALHSYLSSHQYGNAKTIELWNALEYGNLEVGQFMSTWTDQPGFPLVIIEKGEKEGEYTLRQERFFYASLLSRNDWDLLLQDSTIEGGADFVLNNEQSWIIQTSISELNPKKASLKKDQDTLTIKDKTPVKIALSHPSNLPWINLDHGGAYHVLYPEDVLGSLSKSLLKNQNMLSPLDRAGLLVDSFALCWSGRFESVSTLMEMTKFLEFERDTNVWKTAIQEFNVLEAALSLHSSFGFFLKYQRNLMRNIVKDLGWTEKSLDASQWHIRSLLRSELLSEMIAVEDAEAVKTALNYFTAIKEKGLKSNVLALEPQILNVIYDTGVIYGNEDDYNWIMAMYTETTFAADQEKLLHALASTRKPYLQHRTLEFAISGRVRKQDVMTLIRQVALLGGPTGPVIVWTFLRTNWDRVVKFWEGSDWTKLNEMISTLVSRFRQKSLVDDVERLFLKKEDPSWFVPPRAEISIRKGLEKSLARIAWTEMYGTELEQWLHREVNSFSGIGGV